MNWKLIATASLAGAVLVGCAATGVMQIGQDRWMISDQSGIYWSGGAVVPGILAEATGFCASRGQQVEVLDTQTQDAQGGWSVRYASATITFTCK